MDRRTALAFVCTGTLSACANRGPRPSLETVNIRNLGLLPIKEVPPSGNIGPFGGYGGSAAATRPMVPINPATLGIAIGQALSAASEARAAAERNQISDALRATGFVPKQSLTESLTKSLQQRAVPVTVVENELASERARADWVFGDLPLGLDAVLDVKIDYWGYYLEKEAGGYVPTMYVSAQLLATAGSGARLEKYYYRADYYQKEDDRRRLKTKPELIVPSLDQFPANASRVREAMIEMAQTVGDRLAEDADRAIKKLETLY